MLHDLIRLEICTPIAVDRRCDVDLRLMGLWDYETDFL